MVVGGGRLLHVYSILFSRGKDYYSHVYSQYTWEMLLWGTSYSTTLLCIYYRSRYLVLIIIGEFLTSSHAVIYSMLRVTNFPFSDQVYCQESGILRCRSTVHWTHPILDNPDFANTTVTCERRKGMVFDMPSNQIIIKS